MNTASSIYIMVLVVLVIDCFRSVNIINLLIKFHPELILLYTLLLFVKYLPLTERLP